MVFTGRYEHTIDAKGRLAVPSDVRAQWRQEDGDAWYALPVQGMVRLYTEAGFRELAGSMLPRTLATSQEAAEFKRLLFSRSARLPMDSAGRVRIPEWMLTEMGIGREVFVLGSGDCLEVVDRGEYGDTVAAGQEKLDALMGRIGVGLDGMGGGSAGGVV